MARAPSVPRLEQPGLLERFYQLLLQFERDVTALSLIEEALRLIATITHAATAYVEVFGAEGILPASHAYDVEQRTCEAIAASIPRDVVLQAVSERRTVALDSSNGNDVVATLCVPIKIDAVIGVIWLERKQSGFSELDRDRVRLFAKRIAAVCDERPRRTLREQSEALQDRQVYETLVRCNGNVSEAARELGVSRAFIYSVLKRRRGRDRKPS